MAALTARLETRISTNLQVMLKRSAELQSRTVTDFVIIIWRLCKQGHPHPSCFVLLASLRT